MSYSRNASLKQRNSPSAPRKPYCKVCHDAGKTETEYTSHYVRETPEPSSRVVCPTLLCAECNYCYKIGHTPSCCPALKEKKRLDERSDKERERISRTREHAEKKQQQQAPAPTARRFGGFSALADSSDDDEKLLKAKSSKKKPREEFPCLVSKLVKELASKAAEQPAEEQPATSWAARVALGSAPKPQPNGMVTLGDFFTGEPLQVRESVFTKALGLNVGVNIHNSNRIQVIKPRA